MKVLAFDLSMSTGWSFGSSQPNVKPEYGLLDLRLKDTAWKLLETKEKLELCAGKMGAFILERLTNEETYPDLIFWESPMSLYSLTQPANVGKGPPRVRSEVAVLLPHILIGAICGVIHNFGIATDSAPPQTIRKHFTGRGRVPKGEDPKAGTIMRCHQLGFLPYTNTDDNIADAIAVWDYACATRGRRGTGPADLFRR